MMLSPIPSHELEPILRQFKKALGPHPLTQIVFGRIAATLEYATGLDPDLYAGHGAAVALADSLGLATCDEKPAQAYSWDGHVVRTRTETAVLLHEIAHWQIAPVDRRRIPDFGLGAGPETGRKEEAELARCVDDVTKEQEEDLASLLGILWEVRLGGPAILAFCEQNWLELHDRPGTAQHFVAVLNALIERGLLDGQGVPIGQRDLPSAV